MNQLFKKEDLIGKTISDVIVPSSGYENLWIKFNDGSFIIFDVNDIGTGFSHQDMIMIEQYGVYGTEPELCRLGIITESERLDNIKKEEDDRNERYRIEEEKRENENKDRELKLLEELKNKYNL